MDSQKPHRISVKNLIDICLKQGDLSSGYVSRTRALDGIREHIRQQNMRPENYQKEVSVSALVEDPPITLEVFGRIDGVLESENKTTIEEIKTCVIPAREKADNPSPMHLAQIKCYGHMFASKHKLDSVILVLTYVRVGSQTSAEVKKEYPAAELALFFNGLVTIYLKILHDYSRWQALRNNSIKNLNFPYPAFRDGQRPLSESVYKIIKNERILFARAPTGIGKTIAALFPAVKSLGMGQIEKIFYLTAKTVGRTVALKALDDMRDRGLKIKSVVITAKQKACLVSDETCDMETCSFARDYYGKLSEAMPKITRLYSFDRESIEDMARTYELCPFELSLDISLICDVIICDLNYCFDPRVYLKRYFDNGRPNTVFLIDEAHNLTDRLRSMYSAVLVKSDVLSMQRAIRDIAPKMASALVAVNKEMLAFRRRCADAETQYLSFHEIPEAFLRKVRTFAGLADLWLDNNREESPVRSQLMDFYFQANIFLVIAGYFDDNYSFLVERSGRHDLIVTLFCMDPSPVFSDLIERSRSSIFFSATLTPMDYYQQMLFGSRIEPFSITLPSPFPKENLGLYLHKGIRTTYRQRDRYYQKTADLIRQTVNIKKGNYMIYFPSYAFLNAVVDLLEPESADYKTLIQTPGMTEEERQAFLDAFSCECPVTGFAVMGGIFGEGIDLAGDRLIGTIIISAGVPQVCPEQELIRTYFDHVDGNGFFNSYQMPGFNRVMQAAGRVIRTDTDKGIVVLVDERFNRPDYRQLFPPEWQDVVTVSDTSQLVEKIAKFWAIT